MKMTIGEIVDKLKNIDAAICNVRARIDHNCYDSLEDAVEYLEEYRDMIRATKVDILGG